MGMESTHPPTPTDQPTTHTHIPFGGKATEDADDESKTTRPDLHARRSASKRRPNAVRVGVGVDVEYSSSRRETTMRCRGRGQDGAISIGCLKIIKTDGGAKEQKLDRE